ncbi:MAG: nucleoside deaminase [Lachnospiraceae bacterium]|nr:nucleoside deaminase [Lachnospiraceae bacterium]
MALEYMDEAIAEAYRGVREHDGGPFGCVIVKDGKIVGRGHNRVLLKKDPTCHGEMEAIRDACQTLGTHDLSGCVLYTTAEPCPMCLGGILWSNITEAYYGCSKKDTADIGFRDDLFYDYLNGKKELLSLRQEGVEGCKKLFEDFAKDQSQQRY